MAEAAFRAAGVVIDSASTSATTSPTITVPASVVSADYCLLIVSWVGTSGEDPGTYTPSGGSWSTVLAPGTYSNMGFALYQKTGLAATNTFTVTGSVARLYTIGHVYYSSCAGFSTVGAVTSRGGVSLATTTAASITPTSAGSTDLVVSVERTAASGTTISSVSPAATQRTFGEGTGSSTNTVYAGEFTGATPAAATSARTITYNSASGNGAALQLQALPSGSTVNADAALSATFTGSATATAARAATASLPVVFTGSATATAARAATASLPVVFTGTATAEVVNTPGRTAALELVFTGYASAEVTGPRGGWGTLLAIRDDRLAELRSGPPAACPVDGEPLSDGPNGELFCTFDGWRWRGW